MNLVQGAFEPAVGRYPGLGTALPPEELPPELLVEPRARPLGVR
jgi:hypothetical protein